MKVESSDPPLPAASAAGYPPDLFGGIPPKAFSFGYVSEHFGPVPKAETAFNEIFP